MPIDPKLSTRLPTLSTTRPTVAQPTPTVQPLAQPARQPGFDPASTFVPSRPNGVTTTRTGGSDDSIGRGSRTGGADDSIGRGSKTGGADDSIGRKKGTGGSDDGIGRTKGKGQGGSDDSIGGDYESVRLALVGRDDSEDASALRAGINQHLETPSFLKKGESSVGQVFSFAQKNLSLSDTQVSQLQTALKGASAETTKLMGALLEKSPDALTRVDGRGETLLSNLARLASQPLNASLASETSKSELMESVLRDIVNPNRIDQGDAPTCTVTSMQFELVADEPAEYARLMADLTGPQGRAKMRGGSELQLQPGDGATREGRSISQTVFQTVAMEFGNGRQLDFDGRAGGSLDASGKLVQRGLKPEQQTQVLRQLFGVNYRSELFQTEAEGAKVLEKLRALDTRGMQNRPIILQIDQGAFNHAVTFEKVAEDKVFFRDPYGALRSMPQEQFKTFVVGIQAPKELDIVR